MASRYTQSSLTWVRVDGLELEVHTIISSLGSSPYPVINWLPVVSQAGDSLVCEPSLGWTLKWMSHLPAFDVKHLPRRPLSRVGELSLAP